ncbi:MAG: hypothetical protein GWN84_24125 [Gammaproteobacteria bacterium]|nr:hypothetical protein [Gammaproteobacteria bacterium]NIR85671.1 hypothetical protein [Gammaproteobacteria bacterium]NIR90159.1 hypothetical protein [Gammaproteobacteria bacterium]NIU06805.1 hypothetical protein [Gammaproteobacteria bacterium]NIV53738.1 hypothetical protein [Gammaproteobacteria bacterium]
MERERFIALWRRCPARGGGPEPFVAYDELRRLYAEPHRRYHTSGHLQHCLGQFELARDLVHQPDAVEMALWFHDAIYQPSASDNEQRSAQLFLRWAQGCFEAGFARKVCDLILITEHETPPRTTDEKFIADIDLSSLGLDWEIFRRDSDAVREEFSHLSDAEYYPAHARFLRSLLERPRFYFTDFFSERYEDTARRNIERYLGELAKANLV